MFKRILFISLAIIINISFLNAQDCNCDHTIEPSDDLQVFTASDFDYKPGDVFCLNAGTYDGLRFTGFEGTKDNPLIFKNCGGLVELDPVEYQGLFFLDSRFFRITGSGDSEVEYGISIKQTKGGRSGLAAAYLSTDIEVDHVEVANTGFAGIIIKTDPECDDSKTWRGNFTMKNVIIHDNYIHDTGGEGMYIGNSFGYENSKLKCDGVERFAHILENTKIYNNLIEDTGWDGLQVSLGDPESTEVYNNTIIGYGTAKESIHNAGIQLGSGCGGKFYNNKVIQKDDYAIEKQTAVQVINGLAGLTFFNNVIVNPGEYGIWVHLRFSDASIELEKSYNFINNTIVDAGKMSGGDYGHGIFWNTCIPGGECRDYVKNVFANNVIIDPGENFDNSGFWAGPEEAFIHYNSKALRETAVKMNNVFARTSASAVPFTTDQLKFVSTANDNYQIAANSVAIDAGMDVSSYGITFDFNNNGRPFGAAFDAGAFEFGSSNQVPSIELLKEISGNINQVITLDGSAAFDPDGTIASYEWALQEGESENILITDQDKAIATVVASKNGEYVFRLTVTDNQGGEAQGDVTLKVGGVSGLLSRQKISETLITQVHPNPFSNAINFTINAENNAQAEIALLNENGKRIKTLFKNKTLTKGENKLNYNFIDQSLNPGRYLLMIKMGGQSDYRVLIKE